MLQKSKKIRKGSSAPKPKKEYKGYLRYIISFWDAIKWIAKKLLFFFLLFVGLFIRRVTYLLQLLGLNFTLAYWVSVLLAIVLPLSILIILASFVVQWYRKKKSASKKSAY